MIRRLLLGTTWLLAVGLAGADPDPEAEGPQAVLRWEARFEQAIYGYVVYRADDREGPFVRVSEIVHARPSEGEAGTRYAFADTDVKAGRTYFYYLGTVSRDGKKRRFSGVMSKTVAPGARQPAPG